MSGVVGKHAAARGKIKSIGIRPGSDARTRHSAEHVLRDTRDLLYLRVTRTRHSV